MRGGLQDLKNEKPSFLSEGFFGEFARHFVYSSSTCYNTN